MENKVNLNIVVREEQEGKNKIFIVSNDNLGIADFGDTLDEAINNFKKSARLFLDTYPEKREELIDKELEIPPLVTRIFL